MRIIILTTGLTLAAFLAACGSHEPAASSAATAKPASAATLGKPQPANSGLSQDLVAAVTAAHTGTANVAVKFELRGRPQIAQPLDIDMVIVPAPATDRIYGTVEAGDGLQLADGAQIPLSERPPEGMPIHHAVRVLPARDGIFMVNTTVTVDARGQSASHSFSIPVIVGEGVPTPKPAPTAEAVKPVASR